MRTGVRRSLALGAVAGLMGLGLVNVQQCRAQSEPETGTKPPSFAVAAIKPNHGGGSFKFGFEPGGRLVAENVTLGFVLEHAYGVKDFQVSGGPAWIDSEHYNIEAQPDIPEERQTQRWLMLQALLADRFRLTLHRETKQMPVYALVVAKGGPKLQETADKPQRKHGMRTGKGEITMNGYGLDRLTDALSQLLGRVVLDRTGLTGRYDLTLKWLPGEDRGPMVGGPLGDAAPPEARPSIFTALQEQLGLRLESQKGPVETLVIDHVEKPSAN